MEGAGKDRCKMRSFVCVMLVIGLVAIAGASGCADPAQSQTLMDFLRNGNFKGHVKAASGGSPAQVGSKQTFFIGPENASLDAEGEVDFSDAEGDVKAFDAAKGGDQPETPAGT